MSRPRPMCECGRPATYRVGRHGRQKADRSHDLCRQCARTLMGKPARPLIVVLVLGGAP